MTTKQVILSGYGDSWLGFYSTDDRLVKKLNDLRELTHKKKYRDWYWLVTLDGELVEEGDIGSAMNMETHLIVVHSQNNFI